MAEELLWVVRHTEMVDPRGDIRGVCRAPDDDVIIESAVISGPAYIVTGDNDLLGLRGYRSVQIISAGDFVRTILPDRG